jgi:hypothetical protein
VAGSTTQGDEARFTKYVDPLGIEKKIDVLLRNHPSAPENDEGEMGAKGRNNIPDTAEVRGARVREERVDYQGRWIESQILQNYSGGEKSGKNGVFGVEEDDDGIQRVPP